MLLLLRHEEHTLEGEEDLAVSLKRVGVLDVLKECIEEDGPSLVVKSGQIRAQGGGPYELDDCLMVTHDMGIAGLPSIDVLEMLG